MHSSPVKGAFMVMESIILHGAQVCLHIGRCASNKTILDLYNNHYVMVQ